MKHLSRTLIMTLFIIIISSTILAAQEKQRNAATLETIIAKNVLRIGVNPSFKPFSFEQKGRRVGVDVDIATLLAKKLGVKAEIVVPQSFAELIPMLENGQVDIALAAMSITFDRAKVVEFSDPYFHTGLSILLNKTTTSRLGISTAQNYEDLKKALSANGKANQLKVAVTQGKAPEHYVARYFPKAIIKKYPTNEAAANATIKGDADIMVHDEIFLKVWLQENAKEAKFKAVVLDPPFRADHYGIAIGKGNQELLNMINVFIMELEDDDQVNQFLEQYLPVSSKVVTRSYNLNKDYYGGD